MQTCVASKMLTNTFYLRITDYTPKMKEPHYAVTPVSLEINVSGCIVCSMAV